MLNAQEILFQTCKLALLTAQSLPTPRAIVTAAALARRPPKCSPGADLDRSLRSAILYPSMVHVLRSRPPLQLVSIMTALLLAWRCTASFVATRIQPPGTPVFWQGAAGISCYRIPSVVQVPRTGALIALAEARHGNCNDQSAREIAARASHDGGRSWTPIRFVAGDSANGDKWLGNPAIVVTASGRLLLAVSKHAPGCVGNWCAPSLSFSPVNILSAFRCLCDQPLLRSVVGNAVAFSDDDGNTWSELEEIQNLGDAGRSRAGPGLALLIEQGRAMGRVLVPASTGTYGRDFAYVTDDDGRSFQASGIQKPGMDEAQATQLPDGRLLMIMRHTQEGTLGKAATTSDDGGSTWSPIHYLQELKGPVCQASITTFGGATFFSGPDSSDRRERLTVKRSDDSARSWPRKLLLDAGCVPSHGRAACPCLSASPPLSPPPVSWRSHAFLRPDGPSSRLLFAGPPAIRAWCTVR